MTGTDSITLEPVATSPAAARRWVRRRLTELGLDPLEDSVLLLTSEVVTNAVLHAGSPLRLSLRPEGHGVRVEVQDSSPVLPTRRRHAPTSAIGRGMTLLDHLANDWGWHEDGAGKTVWFRISPEQAGTDGGEPDPQQPHVDPPQPVAEPQTSALGRYTPSPDGVPMVRVRLLGLPVQLVAAGQEHHDGLMREFRILALSGKANATDAPTSLVELVQELGNRYGAVRARRDEEIQAALEQGELAIDQVFDVPASAAPAIRHLAELMDEADAFCEQNLLLTLARPPLLREFADWYLGQVIDQVAGRPPAGWTGPLTIPD